MRRRTLLRALGTASPSLLLAGCTGSDEPAPPAGGAASTPDGSTTGATPTEHAEGHAPTDDEPDHDDRETTADIATEPCHGTWFDTHVHRDEVALGPLVDRMDANGVGCSVLFTAVSPDDPEGSVDDLREGVAPHPGRFVPFLHLDPQRPSDMRRERLEAAYGFAPDAFFGVGEVAFYRPPFRGTRLTDDPWPDVFSFAAEHGLFVMLHLTAEQADGLDRMLADHPEAPVLLHGFELRPSLPDLLGTYPQLHFTLDTANLLVTRDGPLMFPGAGVDEPVDRFVEAYDAQHDQLLETAVQTWRPVLDAAPDRVTWGTDVAFEWHLERRVYDRLVAFSTAFVDRLPEARREAYAAGNAARVFDGGVVLEESDDHHEDDHN